MKYALTCSSKMNDISKYLENLNGFKIEAKPIYDTEDEVTVLYYVRIDSLEDLDKLKNKVKCKLILLDEWMDKFCNTYCEPCIEIYDQYRE